MSVVIQQRRSLRRKWLSNVNWVIAWGGAALVLFFLADMVWTILGKGAVSFRFSMLTEVTQGIAGGLQNAILGTLELIVIALVIAGTLGVLGGVFSAEFASRKFGVVIRFISEVLSGVPSIVIGYAGYLLMVLQWGWKFSALAGGIALTCIMLPYILRITESSLQQVPLAQREGAWALGMTKFQAIRKVIWRPAASGIITGILMAISIGLGETAPLLYTAGWSTMNPTGQLIHQPVGYLTYVIWTYLDQPYPQAQALAYSAAFLLVVVILLIHIGLRALVWKLFSVRK